MAVKRRAPRRLALAFIERFCAGDIDRLATLLAARFRFDGPLLCSRSSDEYLEALRRDPPVPTAHRILRIRELATPAPSAVNVRWIYAKPGGPLRVDSRFTCDGGSILGLRLDFRPVGDRATPASTTRGKR